LQKNNISNSSLLSSGEKERKGRVERNKKKKNPPSPLSLWA